MNLKALLVFLCSALLVAVTGHAVAAQTNWTGLWFDPQYSGQGMDMAEYPDGVLITHFFGYQEDGSQMWLVAIGRRDGDSAVLEAWITRGGNNGVSPVSHTEAEWGTFEFREESGVLYLSAHPIQGMGLLLISHDLALVAEVAHRVYVMYAGRTVESGATREIMASASHPLTASLLKAQPRVGELQRRLPVIEGQVLPATAQPQGCVFRERCRRAVDACARSEPPTVQLRAGSHVECHHPILPVRPEAEHHHHV